MPYRFTFSTWRYRDRSTTYASTLLLSILDWPVFQSFLPRIPGHEGIGEVIELGPNVQQSIAIGDRVGIPWIHQTCQCCEYCLTGREEFCLKLIRSGVTVNGCFAQYVVMNAEFAVKLPPDMDPFTSAPIHCAGVTMYKALKTSNVQPGEWILIVGIGGLGKHDEYEE